MMPQRMPGRAGVTRGTILVERHMNTNSQLHDQFERDGFVNAGQVLTADELFARRSSFP